MHTDHAVLNAYHGFRAWRQSCRVFVAVVFAVLVANGCGAHEPSATNKQPGKATTTTVRVAAAANLKFALEHVVAEFHKTHPQIDVQPTYGSSGKLYAQLTHKAPFDVFLSADSEYPARLVAAGLADAKHQFLYGTGQLVIWTSRSSGIDVEKLGIRTLTDPRVNKIAIANPAHAPYGRAAETAIKELGAYNDVKDRLVLGENIAQAAAIRRVRRGRRGHPVFVPGAGAAHAGPGKLLDHAA